jgi:restriction endonuclease Mrr
MPESRIPKRRVLARALVEFLSDGQVRDDDEICESLIQRFGIDESTLSVNKRTGRPRFRSEIDFAKGLAGDKGKGDGLIRQVSDKHYQILPAGLAALSE